MIPLDTFSKEKRSQIMGSVKSKGTGPERAVRKALRGLGLKYKLNQGNLPGSPDILVPEIKVAIFVNGCFWHRHKKCKYASIPETNRSYWEQKFLRNTVRDKKNLYEIKKGGLKSLVIWECETKDESKLSRKIRSNLIKPPIPLKKWEKAK